MTAEFGAPWSRQLILVSALATVLILVVTAILAVAPDTEGFMRILVAAAPLAVLAGSALFAVRGYELSRGSLLVRRLLWTTEIPLSGLERARQDPSALRGSIRLFGNGGLYSFHGIFWNSALGRYHAYATDPRRAVVLVLDSRTVVVTPDDPRRFLEQLARVRPGARIEEATAPAEGSRT